MATSVSLEGKRILVTGSARGLGRAFAEAATEAGASVVVADILVEEESRDVVALPATASVQELVGALNTLGVTPRDLIAILQAMKAAGAIDADLEVL